MKAVEISAFVIAAVTMVSSVAQSAASSEGRSKVVMFDNYVCDRLEYPVPSLRVQAQGVVRMRFSVLDDGSIVDVQVVQSAGDSREHRLLDLVSKRQLESCRYNGIGKPLGPGARDVETRWTLN